MSTKCFTIAHNYELKTNRSVKYQIKTDIYFFNSTNIYQHSNGKIIQALSLSLLLKTLLHTVYRALQYNWKLLQRNTDIKDKTECITI